MIYSGEFRLHLDLISKVLEYDKNAKVALNRTIIDIRSSNINYESAKVIFYTQNALSTVYVLEKDSIIGDSLKISYIRTLIEIIFNQYRISIDQFLEENYIELPSVLKNVFIDLGISTEKYGNKKCLYSDINSPISGIQYAKYSGKLLTWKSLGGFNSDYSADFY